MRRRLADALAITGYVQATNDYIFRGISQNRRDVTLQGGFDATYKMFYVGTFTSGVDFDLKNWYACDIIPARKSICTAASNRRLARSRSISG